MQDARQIWEETVKTLQNVYERREAERVCLWLLEDAFGIKQTDVLSSARVSVDLSKLKLLVDRLLTREPIQYVTGVADFYGRRFHIAEGSLIPRPETEELCSLIIQDNKVAKPKIVDIGTGSGCIAITLALELSGSVHGLDISPEALAIAEKNGAELKSSVKFAKCDILHEPISETAIDILVSNPPYIPMSDMKLMDDNILNFEPELALFVPDDDPLLFYEAIARKGRHSLNAGGHIYFEIHENYGMATQSLLRDLGYMEVLVRKDMQGKDRYVSAIR